MKTNYHTHTTYCDGHNSMRDFVLAAIDLGFDSLGFSAHSLYPFSSDWHIGTRDGAFNIQGYLNEGASLKKEFCDKISILTGFEADYLPPITTPSRDNYLSLSPDYLIGSVHYITNDKGFFTADGKIKEITDGIKNYWAGNAKSAISTYFETQRKMLSNCDFLIWGHPDVIRRRNDALKFFCEEDSWYKEEVRLTAKAASKAGVIAEINTGGWARGNIKDIYPSKYFLQLLHDYKIPIIINTDAHEVSLLDFGIEEAKKIARDMGYKETAYLDRDGAVRFIPL